MIFITQPMMFDSGAIDAAGVQKVLEAMKSWLVNFKVGAEPFSVWLVRMSVEHGYNPLFWLAMLQKEQSLTEAKSPPDQKKLDWALGYGCPEGGGRNSLYCGFERQFYCTYKNKKGAEVAGGAMPQFKNYATWDQIKRWKTAKIKLCDPPQVLKRYGFTSSTIVAESYEDALNYLYNPRAEGISNLHNILSRYHALAEQLGVLKQRKDG